MKNLNSRIIFLLRLLKNILGKFVDVFLVLYFLDVSDSNILPLGIYKLIAMFTVWLTMVLVRNYCKSKNRIWLLRLGIILYFGYFLAIALLRERVVDYIYLIGFVYGLEEGLYFSVYHSLESDSVPNRDRERFLGIYHATSSIVALIFPLIFGGLIYESGFTSTIFVVLGIVIAEILLSVVLRDQNVPKASKTDSKAFRELVKKRPEYKHIFLTYVCHGLTYSEGALTYVVTIYIIKIFSESVSLGIFTSLFSLVSMLIGFLFVKIIKPRYYVGTLLVFLPLNVISLIVMLTNCSFSTVVLYNFFYTVSKELSNLIIERNSYNFSNLGEIRRQYKVEYFLSLETALVIGRVISNGLFVVMAFTNVEFIMWIFIGFVVLDSISIIRWQSVMNVRRKRISGKRDMAYSYREIEDE